MRFRPGLFAAALASCAPLPALVIGIVAMRKLGVSTLAWSTNMVATVLGLLIWVFGRRLPPPTRRRTRVSLAAASIVAILLPFASEGTLGVHRWVPVAGVRFHASAIVAPLIILCIAADAAHGLRGALALGATAAFILALQPDAAQTTGLAAACAVVLVCSQTTKMRSVLLGILLLCVVSAVPFMRHDPLSPVVHVEKIFSVVAFQGAGWAAIATVAMLLLPAPFFVAWYSHRRSVTLALGVYIAMTLLAPAWGTFPVPVMGYGASPILGYFIALTMGLGESSQIDKATTSMSWSSST